MVWPTLGSRTAKEQEPIIVASFSAAQKVAATHVDVMLNADPDRVFWAKKSLA